MILKAEDPLSGLRKIPYTLENSIKRNIFEFLNQQPKPYKADNGKILDVKKDKTVWLIENQISRLNNTELNLFFEKLQENGMEWGTNYLVGGNRVKDQLCLVESKTVEDIRNDNFPRPWQGESRPSLYPN